MLSYISSITISSKFFINFAKSSFCPYWDIFIFILYYACKLYYIYLFVYVEQSLYPWNETNFMMVHYLCNMNFIHFVCFYFIENFASVHEGNWSKNCFFVVSIYGFGIKIINSSWNEFGRSPSLYTSYNILRSVVVYSSLKFW
jgi:hypothetical protein